MGIERRIVVACDCDEHPITVDRIVTYANYSIARAAGWQIVAGACVCEFCTSKGWILEVDPENPGGGWRMISPPIVNAHNQPLPPDNTICPRCDQTILPNQKYELNFSNSADFLGRKRIHQGGIPIYFHDVCPGGG